MQWWDISKYINLVGQLWTGSLALSEPYSSMTSKPFFG